MLNETSSLLSFCTLRWQATHEYFILENLAVATLHQGEGPQFLKLVVKWLEERMGCVDRWGVWIDVDNSNDTCLRQFENVIVGEKEEKFKRIEKENMKKLSWKTKVNTNTNFAFLFPEHHYKHLITNFKIKKP